MLKLGNYLSVQTHKLCAKARESSLYRRTNHVLKLGEYLPVQTHKLCAKARELSLCTDAQTMFITVLRRRTELFSKSFIPSTTSYWNSLPMCIRNADFLNSFKSQLKSSIFKVPRIPQQFISGSRVFSVLHCRIRNNCSNLNSDLFLNHLRTNAVYEWDSEIEDSEHYFFK